jgi:hypothetical protein
MTRDGDYSWDCFDRERERFDAIIEMIIEELREPYAFVGHGDLKAVTYKPGEPAGSTGSSPASRTRARSTSSSTRNSVTERSLLLSPDSRPTASD